MALCTEYLEYPLAHERPVAKCCVNGRVLCPDERSVKGTNTRPVTNGKCRRIDWSLEHEETLASGRPNVHPIICCLVLLLMGLAASIAVAVGVRFRLTPSTHDPRMSPITTARIPNEMDWIDPLVPRSQLGSGAVGIWDVVHLDSTARTASA